MFLPPYQREKGHPLPSLFLLNFNKVSSLNECYLFCVRIKKDDKSKAHWLIMKPSIDVISTNSSSCALLISHLSLSV